MENLLQIKGRTHSSEFRFDHELDLGTHKIENRPVQNYEILADALSLRQRPLDASAEKRVESALPSLGVERFVRIDYKHHGIIELRGHKYNSLLVMEAPWNVTKRRLEISTMVRMDAEFGLRFPEAVDWKVACFDFYRETILRRFLANLLAYTTYTYKE